MISRVKKSNWKLKSINVGHFGLEIAYNWNWNKNEKIKITLI